MEYLPEVVNYVLVVLVGFIVTYVVRDKARQQDKRIDGVEKRLDGIQLEMRTEFGAVRSEIASLRSDLTQVALHVGVGPEPRTG